MAQQNSPNIVTSGLVFAYDMNSPRSYAGQPTTNLVGSAASMSGWNSYSNGNDGTFTTEFGTTGYRMNARGSWNGINKGITIPSTGTYTFSAYFRYWGGSSNNNGAQVYVSGWGGGDTASGLDKTKIGVWQRVSLTLSVTTASCTFYIISYGGTSGADNSTWEVTMPQVEAVSYATAFADSSRSTTQALLDLTRNNTWTVNNLTYAADGTFSFNGSNGWIESATSSVFDSQSITMESWCKPTTTSQSGFLFEKGQVNTQYSNFFNSDGTFYFRTIGLSPQDLTFPSSTYITANQWNHIVCVVGSGTKTVYINGTQRYQQTGVTGSMPTGQTNQYVGKYGNSGNNYPFSGSIAISRVYNRALTATEVQQNFNAHRGRFGV